MAISSIPSVSAAPQPTKTLGKQAEVSEVSKEKKQAAEQTKNVEERAVQAQIEARLQAQNQNRIDAQKASEQKAVVNTSGQTVGGRINTTA